MLHINVDRNELAAVTPLSSMTATARWWFPLLTVVEGRPCPTYLTMKGNRRKLLADARMAAPLGDALYRP